MNRFARRITPQLLSGLLAVAMLGAPAPAASAPEDKSEKELAVQALAITSTLQEIDDRCHLLKAEERGRLNLHVSELTRDLGVDPKSLAPPAGVDPIPCDSELARVLIGSLRETVLAPAPAPEEDEATWEDFQRMWQDNLRTLPAGRLGAYEGCWTGSLSGLAVEVCLAKKGDVVTVHLREGGQEWCALAPGSARSREELIIFFAPAATGTCRDGSRLQHLEGGCTVISESTLDCIFSVYSKGNNFYLLRGEYLNGQATLKRSTTSTKN